MINTPKINEDHVLKLSDLIRSKQDLIRARKSVMDTLANIPNPSLLLTLKQNHRHESLIGDSNSYLERAMSEEAGWVIDRVYDSAIQQLDIEIADVAEKLMKNLMDASVPY